MRTSSVVGHKFLYMGTYCALGWALKAPSSASSEEPRHGLLMGLPHPIHRTDVCADVPIGELCGADEAPDYAKQSLAQDTRTEATLVGAV